MVSDVVERGPEAASKSALLTFEVVRVENTKGNVVLVKDGERKRHCDDTSSP